MPLAIGMMAFAAHAEPLGEADVRFVQLAIDIDTREDLEGLQTSMTAVRDVPAAVLTIVGGANLSIDPQLPAGSRVEAIIVGPAFPGGAVVDAPPNARLELPRLSVSGQYRLEDIVLLDAKGEVVLTRSPLLDSVTIDVIDEVLVTQVTTEPLTAEEIQEKGIIVDEDNFTAVNFTVGFTLGSEEVEVELPLLLPDANAQLDEPPPVPAVTLGGSTASGFETIDIPNFAISGFSLTLPPEVEVPEIELPPINGVVIIPGSIAFLNQFFSVMVITTNVSPDGSGLVVENARARIILPPGRDDIAGTGDDPLDLATVQGGGNEPEQPLLDAAGTQTIEPQDTHDAEFLVEGLREGTHRVTFDIEGDLFVPSLGESVPIAGKAAGIVQVRNPTFNIVLAHPQVVRAGEAYSVFATVTNTSRSPANFFSLGLDNRSFSGVRLAEGATDTFALETLEAADSATFELEMVALTTGEVTGTVFLADPSVNGAFLLSTGVSAEGIPLSPDSIILPQTVQYLDDDLVTAAVRLLGQGYSVATAPAGTLPPEISRMSKGFVFDRAVALAQAGLHVRFGETPPDCITDLIEAFVTAEVVGAPPTEAQALERLAADIAAFDQLRRSTAAGGNFSDVAGQTLSQTLNGTTLTDLQRNWAERIASRGRHLTFGAQTDGASVFLQLADSDGNTTGRLSSTNGTDREIPFATAIPLDGGGLIHAGRAEADGYELSFFAPDATTLSLSVVLPTAGGMQAVEFAPTAVSAGAFGVLTWSPQLGGDIAFAVDTDGDGLTDTSVDPLRVDAVVDRPPVVLGVHQWAKGNAPETPLRFEIGDPLGRLVGVLFDEPIEPLSAGLVDNYVVDGRPPTQAVVQPDERLVFLTLDRPVGPFVPRDLSVDGIPDRAGLSVTGVEQPVVADPERGVGGSVEGVVRAADGTPIPFASLTYLQPVYCPACDFGLGRTDDRIISRFTTGPDGAYALDYVLQNELVAQNPDRWLSGGSGPGTNHFKLEALDPQSGIRGRASTRIHLDGQRLHLDIIIRGFGSIIGDVFLAGTVMEESGLPVVGGDPDSADALFVFAQNISTGESAVSWVDADGHYAFPRQFIAQDGRDLSAPSVPVGNTTLRVVRPVDASQAVATVNIPAAGAVVEQDLILFPQNRFGRVSGRVVEADGVTGVPGILVQLLSEGGVGVSALVTTNTDIDGNFAFEDVPVGNLELLAFRSATFEQVRVTSFLAEGQETSVLLILPGSGATVRGFVVDAFGDLVEGATVAAGPVLTSTDPNGFFEVVGLPLGNVTVFAQGPDGGLAQAAVTLASSGSVQEVVLTLEPVGSVFGRILRADGATPVANQEVQLWLGQGLIGSTFSDAAGDYRFEGFPLGDYQVRAVEADFGDGGATTTALRFAGDVRQADVTYRGVGGGQGRVIQSDATPIIADIILTRKVWRVLTDRTDEEQQVIDRVTEFGSTDPVSEQLAGAFLNEFAQPVTRFFVLRDEPVLLRSDILGPAGEVTGRFDFQGPITGGGFRLSVFGPFLSPTLVSGEIPRTTDPAARIVDVGDIVLVPTTGQVAGTVLMPDGTTATGENIRVSLKSLSSSGTVLGPSGPIPPAIEVTTDAAGTFSFPLVLTGLFTLEADTGAPDPAIAAQTPAEIQTDTFADAGGDRLLNVRLYGHSSGVVPPGETVVVNLRLRDAGGVSVLVVENDGSTPVPFAQVTMSTASALDADEEATFLRVSADGAGRVDFLPVIEGPIHVLAADLVTAANGQASGSIPVDPPSGFALPITVTLGAVTTEDGQVVDAQALGTVSGTVLRADGTPLDNAAEVTLHASGVQLLTTSDSIGAFLFEQVPVGSFVVDVFEPFTARRGSTDGAVRTDGEVVTVQVELVGLGTVAGTVFQNDGETPVSGAEITLFPAGSFSAPLLSTADEQGSFIMGGVAVGEYVLEATEPASGLQGSATGTIETDGETRTTDVLIEPNGSITGLVFGPGTVLIDGQPADPGAPVVAAASVRIVGPRTDRTVQTDGAGRYDAGPFLPLGRYSVTVRPAGLEDGATATADLEFHGQRVEQPLVLRGAGTISGVVFDSVGVTPVDQAQVTLSLRNPFSAGDRVAVTGADGLFQFDDVPVGAFTLSALSSDLPPLGVTVTDTLAAHGDTVAFFDLDADPERDALRLQDAGSVGGRVLLDDGTSPAAGAVLTLTSGELSVVELADDQGQFVFGAVPLDTYTLSVLAPQTSGLASRQVVVSVNGQSVDLGDIVVDSERPVVLSVLPPDGAADVEPATVIEITLSELIDQTDMSSLKFEVTHAGNAIAGTRLASSTAPTLTFTPQAPFPDLAHIRVVLRADERTFEGELIQPGIRDLAGQSLAGDFVFTFTTGDRTPPEVLSLTPLDGATEVDPAAVVRLLFDEPIDTSSVLDATLFTAGSPVPGALSFAQSDTLLVFVPDAPLVPDSTYQFTLSGPVRDTAQNPMGQTTLGTTFTTIDTQPPGILSLTVPPGASTIEGLTVVLTATAADPADTARVEFTRDGVLVGQDTTAPYTLALVLDAALGPSVTIEARAADVAGNRGAPVGLTLPIVPDQAPAAILAAPAASAVSIGSTVQVRVVGSDDVGVTQLSYTAGGGGVASGAAPISPAATATSADFSFEMPNLPVGSEVIVRASALDTRGQPSAGAPESTVTLTVADFRGPSVAIVSPGEGTFFEPGSSFDAFVQATDPSGVSEIRLNAGGAVSFGETRTLTPAVSPAGAAFVVPIPLDANPGLPIALQAIARDSVDNQGVDAAAVNVFDRNPPELQLALQSGSAFIEPGRTETILATATDQVAVAQIDVAVDAFFAEQRPVVPAASVVTEGFDVIVPLTVGLGQPVTVTGQAIDTTGNTGVAAPLVVTTADLSPPTVAIVQPSEGTEVDPGTLVDVVVRATDRFALTRFSFSAAGAVTAVEIRDVDLTGPAATNAEEVFTLAIPADAEPRGQINLVASADDGLGQRGVAPTVVIAVRDLRPPILVASTPADGAIDVAPDITLSAQFDELVDPATVTPATVTLDSTGGPLGATVSLVGGNRIELDPDQNLELSTDHTFTVGAAVADLAGNQLGTPIVIAFRTADPDLTPPEVVRTVPDDGTIAVPVDTAVTIDFSERMQVATLTEANVRLLGPGGIVPAGRSVVDQQRVFLTPSNPLAEGTTYQIEVTTGVRDLAGNALAADFTASFVTFTPDAVAPEVVSVDPADGAVNVQIFQPVEVRFTESVLPGSVTSASFVVSAAGSPIVGIFQFSDFDRVARFIPTAPYPFESQVTVTLTAAITDLAGNPLVPFASSFGVVDQTAVDTDLDGLRDTTEIQLGTDPTVFDDFPNTDVVISGRTATLDEPVTLGSLTLTSGAILTHPTATDSRIFRLELTVDTLVVDATSQINVDNRGYLGGSQPGNASSQGRTVGQQATIRGGGPHGGYGAHAAIGGDKNEGVYGDFRSPNTAGSGGGSGLDSVRRPGGNGGGIVRVFANTVVVDGVIRANGGKGEPVTSGTQDQGGGAGGSVFVSCATISGAGQLIAHGGGLGGPVNTSAAGAGGRVAIITQDATGDMSRSAPGGRGRNGRHGGPGTLYVQNTTWPDGYLTIDNGIIAGDGRENGRVPSVERGRSAALGANTLTTAGGLPVADATAGTTGLVGLELNPNLDQPQTFTIVDNTATEIFTDPADGDMTQVAAAGDDYRAVFALSRVRVSNQSLVVLDADVAGTAAVEVDVGSELTLGAILGGTTVDVTSGTLSVDGRLEASSSVTVASAGVLTHREATTVQSSFLEIVTGVATIAAGGSIDVSERGYLGGRGTASNTDRGRTLGNTLGSFVDSFSADGSHGAAGGSYGGEAGYGRLGAQSNPAYGDFKNPNALGSGGAAREDASGGNGGGLVRLFADEVQLDGSILAWGGLGTANRAGGGSGGGVLIDGNILRGTGVIEARGGGFAGGSGNLNAGSGGGGRIAIYYADNSAFAVPVRAQGASAAFSSTGGAAGTILWKSQSQQFGELWVFGTGVFLQRVTPLRAIGPGTIGALGPQTLTDTTRSFPLPDDPPGALGLRGLELNPGTGTTFTVIDNSGTQLFTDATGGDMTLSSAAGFPYIGVYTFDVVRVRSRGRLITADDLFFTQTLEVTPESVLISNNLNEQP